jgi:hypothetical protein
MTMTTTAPDLMDEILLARARKRTGVELESWWRVDDVWSRVSWPTVSCRACGAVICSAHVPNKDRAIVAHKTDHAQEILDGRRRAFRALDPLDQLFTLPATERELQEMGL